MAPRKASRANGVALEPGAPVNTTTSKPTQLHTSRPSSRIPTPVQILLATVISLSTSYGLLSVGSPFMRNELASVSRAPVSLEDVLVFPALRVGELVLGWLAGFDDYDMASFTFQTRLPYYFLLNTFYAISLRTTSLNLFIDILSASLPFSLLRHRLPAHTASSAPRGSLANRNILASLLLSTLVSTFAATVYAVLILSSYRSWLPSYLVTHFDGLRTLELAHGSQLPVLVLTFFPLGWTAKILLFAPATGAQATMAESLEKARFDPATASLGEHVRSNLWGWSKGTKVMVQRATLLAVGVFLGTWLKTWKSLEGSESAGSAGWAALWALGALLNAALLRWVGHV